MEAGRTASDKVINVSSGTYYIAITTSSSAKDFDFSVQSIGVEYTVKVYANGPDTEPTSTQVVDENASYLLDDPVYQSNGYTYYTGFEGWFTDAALTVPFTSGDAITGNTNIYAKLTGKYRSDLFNLIDTLYSGCFENMTSGAYHWVSDESGKIVSTNDGVSSTSSQMDLVAKKAINISFDYQVSSEKNSDKFYVYTKPTVEGSRTAIINGVSGFDPDVTGSQSVTLEAGNVIQFVYQKDSSLNKGTDKVYLSNFSISEASAVQLTYDFQDGVTPNEVVDVLSGQAITKISDPTREGYRFGGWYTQPLGAGDAFDFASGISANTTIYAYWIETVSLTIYADGPDAAATEVRVVDKGASVTLSTLNSTYYSGFQGWFSNPELTDSLGGLECTFTVSGNMSAYAKHNGKYRMDVFNDIDAAYPGIFSGIGGSTNARHWSYHEGLFVSSGADSSTSELTLTLAVDTVVSFDWIISSESGWDKGSIFYEVSGARTYIANDVSGENNGSFSSTLTAGTVITFRYTKDSSTRAGLDCLKVSNATFVAA